MKVMKRYAMGGLVVGLFACIPAGIILWMATGNSWWLWLCIPLAMFLS